MNLFFFNDTATTEIYTLSLHDALPILHLARPGREFRGDLRERGEVHVDGQGADRGEQSQQDEERSAPRRSVGQDRKSTRLNSSHANISYAVFCLKKKKASDLCARTQSP